MWTTIHKDELFQLEGLLKITSNNCCWFLEVTFLKQRYGIKSKAFTEAVIFMQHTASSHEPSTPLPG